MARRFGCRAGRKPQRYPAGIARICNDAMRPKRPTRRPRLFTDKFLAARSIKTCCQSLQTRRICVSDARRTHPVFGNSVNANSCGSLRLLESPLLAFHSGTGSQCAGPECSCHQSLIRLITGIADAGQSAATNRIARSRRSCGAGFKRSL